MLTCKAVPFWYVFTFCQRCELVLQLDNVRGILWPVDFACEIEGSVEPEGVNGMKCEPAGTSVG